MRHQDSHSLPVAGFAPRSCVPGVPCSKRATADPSLGRLEQVRDQGIPGPKGRSSRLKRLTPVIRPRRGFSDCMRASVWYAPDPIGLRDGSGSPGLLIQTSSHRVQAFIAELNAEYGAVI